MPRAALIRVVRGPEGVAVFDAAGRLPGRGAWVCPEPACVDAVSAGALAHVLRGPVRLPAPPERRAAVAACLGRRVENLLTMAFKARAAVLGPQGVLAALKAGRAALVVLAADLPPGDAGAWQGRAGAVPRSVAGDAATIGRLAGRGPVAVAAVCDEGIAGALALAIGRWRAFSGASCDNA